MGSKPKLVTPQQSNVGFSTHRLHVSNLKMEVTVSELDLVFPGNDGIVLKKSRRRGASAVVTYNDPVKCEIAFNNSKRVFLNGKPIVVSPKLRAEDTFLD